MSTVNTYLDADGGICGIKYWAWWQPFARAPRYQVFKFEIYDPNSGLYYFRSRKDPSLVMARSLAQLYSETFKPFLFDNTKIERYIDTLRMPPNSHA